MSSTYGWENGSNGEKPFRLVWLINSFNRPQTSLKRLKKHCVIMSRDSSSRKGNSQELLRFNRTRLEKCSTEKRQPYQPKPVAVETVDPDRTFNLIDRFSQA